MGLKLYKATLKDARAIGNLNRRLLGGYDEPDDIKKSIKGNNAYVIKDGNTVVAAITIDDFSYEHPCIYTLAVKEKYQRRGLGSWLVNFSKRVWRPHSDHIRVGSEDIYNAKKFYNKLGFMEFNRDETGFDMRAPLV